MQNIKTFIYGELPQQEKLKFLDFMINNNVEFSQDPNDGLYVATIKIVNRQSGSTGGQLHSSPTPKSNYLNGKSRQSSPYQGGTSHSRQKS